MTDDRRRSRGEMDSDSEAAFRDAMSDVEPLRNQRADVEKTRGEPTPAQLQRRHAAVDDRRDAADPNQLHRGEIAMVGARDELSWKKDGVQIGVFRKLRQGKYEIDAELDLHRLTVSEAREAVFKFLNTSRARDLRTLLIAHGRGEQSDPPARIKSYVAHWLEQTPEVIAFHSAPPNRGGTGAVCLLLKKSPQQREDNRERFS
jgi:DNA-nicking Smr family endonuclease